MENTEETPVENGRAQEAGDESAEPQSDVCSEKVNPDQLPDEMKETFLVDAIGDTLYSKRFVLKTLLSLNTLESSLSEEFEKDLCTLWDMTIEKDVVELMLEHNVLEIFSNIVQITESQRLTEILVGMIGNMCSLSQTRDALCQQPEILVPLIELVSCTDSLILVQVMRVFHSCLVFENSGDEIIWYQHFSAVDQFVEKFAFVLSNSMSSSLLLHAYEALNAICTKLAVIEIQADEENKSSFRDLFVKPLLVRGVIDAFQQMFPDKTNGTVNGNGTTAEEEAMLPTKKTQRVINLFLDINVILSQYDQHSVDCFKPFMATFYNCIAQCLEPLCHPMHLLPLTVNEQILIENVSEISQALNDHFHSRCFAQTITIWSIIEKMLADKEAAKNGPGSSDDNNKSEWDREEAASNDGNDDEVSGSDISMTLLEFVTCTSKQASIENIKQSISSLDASVIVQLCDALSAGASDNDIKDCHDKLKEAAKSIWNLEIVSKVDCTDGEYDEEERNNSSIGI